MSLWDRIVAFFSPKPKVIYLPPTPVQMSEPVPGDSELPPHDAKGMIHLGLIVGHEAKSPGAVMAKPYSVYEYFFNKEIAGLMLAYAKAKHPNVIVDVIYRDGIGISGAYSKARQMGCDVALELHFNAANTVAQGTETLCTTDSRDVDFAHTIQDAVCQVFKRQGSSRGVKCISASDRGNINVHSFPGGANCLIEPFFGDNPDEAKFAMDHKQEYAQGLVDAVYLWAKKQDLIKGN